MSRDQKYKPEYFLNVVKMENVNSIVIHIGSELKAAIMQ